jgi:hypothetical protein
MMDSGCMEGDIVGGKWLVRNIEKVAAAHHKAWWLLYFFKKNRSKV